MSEVVQRLDEFEEIASRLTGSEYLIPLSVPLADPDQVLEVGQIFDHELGRIVGFYGRNLTPDTLEVAATVGALVERLWIVPGEEWQRIDLPLSRQVAFRRATLADPRWLRTAGWVGNWDSITVERQFAEPVRHSPSILSAAVTEFFSSATTTHNVPMPATVDAGDGLVVLFFHDNASVVEATGFSNIADASATDRAFVFGKVALGTEDGSNVNFLAGTASFAVAHVYRIQAGTWAGVVQGIQASTATGSGTSPDPPNLAPMWGSNDALWLAYAAKVSGTITGAPTNYTNLTRDSSNLSASARRSLTATSDDPGTFAGSTSAAWMAFTIAIASNTVTWGDIPIFVGVGTTASGTAGVSPGLPAGIQDGDKLLLHIQGEGEDANADPANGDWTLIDSNASATAGAAGDTRHTVYQADYLSASPPSTSIGDAGDHTLAFITAWRNPAGGTLEVHATQGTTDASADTAMSATGVTTSVPNCLIVISCTIGDDLSGFHSWANASLADPTIRVAGQGSTSSGSDGTIGVAFGGLASAGGSGTTTATIATSEEEANWVIALAPVSGAGEVEGAAALSGQGDLTADAETEAEGAAAISGDGALVADAETEAEGAAALSGDGALTADGEGVGTGAAALSGDGALAADAETEAEGLAALEGDGALVADAETEAEGAADLAGSGALTASAVFEDAPEGAAALSGEGVLAAEAETEAEGIAALVGDGALSAAAETEAEGAADLSGDGALTIDAETEASGAAALEGEGALTIDVEVEAEGAAALAGDGALAAEGEAEAEGLAALEGEGALGVSAETEAEGAAALGGEGSLAADGEVPGVDLGEAVLEGAGALTAAAETEAEGAADVSGSGVAVGDAETEAEGAADLAGSGALAASGETVEVDEGAAALAGEGALAAVGETEAEGAADLAGAGALTADGTTQDIGEGAAVLEGGGALSAAAETEAEAAAALAGDGALTIAGETEAVGAAALGGEGSLVADGSQVGEVTVPIVPEVGDIVPVPHILDVQSGEELIVAAGALSDHGVLYRPSVTSVRRI